MERRGQVGYYGYDYTITDGHNVQHYGHAPSDFLNTTLTTTRRASCDDAAARPNPFMLEVAPFSPHQPYTPAPRDVGTFHGAYPTTPAYNRLGPTAPPGCRAGTRSAPTTSPRCGATGICASSPCRVSTA